jgi:hypothetical protein
VHITVIIIKKNHAHARIYGYDMRVRVPAM